ncbi:MAG: hypothetical protein QY322_04505 [bacterium]|nr:MAG: hypothetical protein QY322_04505 [bacterium]
MAIGERATTARSEILDSASFQYIVVPSSNQIFEELTVVISFTFDGKDPDKYLGSTESILDNPQTAESESFLYASEKAWERKYSKTDEKYKKFVKDKLLEKWKELNGEELTGKLLTFT